MKGRNINLVKARSTTAGLYANDLEIPLRFLDTAPQFSSKLSSLSIVFMQISHCLP